MAPHTQIRPCDTIIGTHTPPAWDTLGQVLRLAAADGVRGIVSFVDPVTRHRIDGALVFPGHLGIIYQAANFTCTGRGTGPNAVAAQRRVGAVTSPIGEGPLS
jgi:hypothetical protein